MNSRCLLVIALCGLLVGQRQVRSANLSPQLLPLPAMAQRAADANIPPNEQPGDVQFIQPSITLTAPKDSIQSIDPDQPPMELNRTITIDITRKGPGKDNRPIAESSVPILDKDGKRVGEEILEKRVGANDTSTTAVVIDGTTRGGANQIKATYILFPAIISAITMIFLF